MFLINCSVAPQNISSLFGNEKHETNLGFQANTYGTTIHADDPNDKYSPEWGPYCASPISINLSYNFTKNIIILPFLGFDGIGTTICYNSNDINISGLFLEKSFFNKSIGYGLQTSFKLGIPIFLNLDYFTGYMYESTNDFFSWYDPKYIIQMKMILKPSVTFRLSNYGFDVGALCDLHSKQFAFYLGLNCQLNIR